MTADPLAFGRDERGRALPGRLHHEPRGVTRLPRLALGHQLNSVVIETFPRGVALAENVERSACHREASVGRIAASFEDEIPSLFERNLERHRLRTRRHLPGSGWNQFLLGVPGVEPAALRSTDARPLDLRQGHRHWNTRHRCSVERRGDDLRFQSGLLLEEVGRSADADVPRRGVDDDAGAVRDVLAGHIFDVPFETVDAGNTRLALGLQVEQESSIRGELHLLGRNGIRLKDAVIGRLTNEYPSIVGKLIGDCRRRVESR